MAWLAPVVVVLGMAASTLPSAEAVRSSGDVVTPVVSVALKAPLTAAATTAVSPPAEETARRTVLGGGQPTPTAETLTVDAIPAAAPSTPSAAVDGSVAPDTSAADGAAAQAEAAAALTSHGVVVTDGSTGIPTTVLAAYRKAEATMAGIRPSCHLPWWVLAGIGRIESGHASGGRVDAAGNTRGRILGIVLDGSMAGTGVILDSDGGRWDGDATYDRAVGPMQFLPSSWRYWGRDGNGDGVADPNNVFDAALGAGNLLCAAGDLSDPANLSRAVLSYNHSAAYVASVLRWGTAYRDGVTPAPDSTGMIPAGPVAQPTSTPAVAGPTGSTPTSSTAARSATPGSPAPATPTGSSTSAASSTAPPAPSTTTTTTTTTSSASSTSPTSSMTPSSASSTSPTSSTTPSTTSSTSTTTPPAPTTAPAPPSTPAHPTSATVG